MSPGRATVPAIVIAGRPVCMFMRYPGAERFPCFCRDASTESVCPNSLASEQRGHVRARVRSPRDGRPQQANADQRTMRDVSIDARTRWRGRSMTAADVINLVSALVWPAIVVLL